jgi:hypothetical protein
VGRIQRPCGSIYLVVIVEIDPAPQTLDDAPPFIRVSHDDGSALGIVFFDTDFLHGISTRHAQLLVDLILNRNAMSIPSKSSNHMILLHGPVSGDNVLDRGREEMTVMRETYGE